MHDLLSFNTVAEAAAVLPPSVYPGQEDRLLWYCEPCGTFHALASTHAMTPFTKKHGLCMKDVEQDGDCFYACVVQCLRTDPTTTREEERHLSVARLRDLVARRVGIEQFEFYRMEAEASPKAAHLDFIRPPPPVSATATSTSASALSSSSSTKRDTATARNSARMATVEAPAGALRAEVDSVAQLQDYVRREGRLLGTGNCLWADSFAQMVVAESFRLTILLVDMERDKGCFPFRVMHRYDKEAELDEAKAQANTGRGMRVRAAQRGGSKPSAVTPASVIVGDRGERFIILKRQGPVGHFQFVERVDDGVAVFSQEELPLVVKTIWGL